MEPGKVENWRRKLGSTDYCTRCGKPYLVTAPAQVYCPDCAPRKLTEDRSAYVRASSGGGPRRLGTTDVCARCGEIYVVTGGKQKYCPKCAKALKQKLAKRHLGAAAICERCGGGYTVTAGSQRFCPRCASVKAAEKKRPSTPRPKKPRRPNTTALDELGEIPGNLRDLLEQYGITQSRFAIYFGVDATIVNRWCTGQRVCPPYVLAMAAKVLSLAADDVRGDAEEILASNEQ